MSLPTKELMHMVPQYSLGHGGHSAALKHGIRAHGPGRKSEDRQRKIHGEGGR